MRRQRVDPQIGRRISEQLTLDRVNRLRLAPVLRAAGLQGRANSVEGSAEVYEDLIRRVEVAAAPVAGQVRDEVTRGRLVKGSKLPAGERQARQSRLSEHKLGRISDDEMAVMPYTGDQRLALLCDTLLTLAQTMAASRRAVLAFAADHEIQSRFVEFADPDEVDTQTVHIDLEAEAAKAEQVLARVRELVAPVGQEVGTWQ